MVFDYAPPWLDKMSTPTPMRTAAAVKETVTASAQYHDCDERSKEGAVE